MSQPNPKSELHEVVDDYCQNWISEPIESDYLHEEIDRSDKRTERFDLFMEWVDG